MFGTFFEMGGRAAMEALGRANLDYVIIDTEHSCFSEESTADLILAAERHGLTPYVRIGDVRRPYVLRMLDIGAKGLIVPNIRSVEQVKELVSYAKFPPIGNRGFCPNRTSGWGYDEWAKDVGSYMEKCNQICKVIPQCETKEALENIEEIVALPGVDGIFVGPFDLSVDMGIPLKLDAPVMVDAIEKVVSVCKAYEKESFIFAGNMENAVKWTKLGYDNITYNFDIGVFIDAWRSAAEKYRKESGSAGDQRE